MGFFVEKEEKYYGAGIIFLICVVLFLIPPSLLMFSFSGVAFLKGEIWRLFTFPFVHTSTSHFLENMGALAVTSYLAYVIGIKNKDFLIVFLGSGLLLALADSVLFPALVVAGASLGIYAILGTVSTKGSNFISKNVLFVVFLSSIFFKYIISFFTGQEIGSALFSQTVLHLFGFISGILIFYLLSHDRVKKRILTLG